MMNLGVLFEPHPAAWRHPQAPAGAEHTLQFYIDLARKAEEGKLDFIFFADAPSSRAKSRTHGDVNAIERTAGYIAGFEPTTLLSALAVSTSRVGLAATMSTTFFEPFNLARLFASLDLLSGGRAAWNVVTTAAPEAPLNFSLSGIVDHARRYQRAGEFTDVVLGLWNSWDDDAFVVDKDAGIYFDGTKVRHLNHAGEFFKVRGPLNVPRSPQGRPVVINASGSVPGRELAARTADVVFSSDRTLEEAKQFYDDVKGRMAKYGREAHELKILTALLPYVRETDAEARGYYDELTRLIHPDAGRYILSVDLGVDLAGVPIDEPLSEDILPKSSNRTTSYFETIVRMIREERVTLRQLYEKQAAARGNLNPAVGSVSRIAARMEQWFRSGACDGFMIGLPLLPVDLDVFVELVVPELQRRGLFRQEYSGATLRENLFGMRESSVAPG